MKPSHTSSRVPKSIQSRKYYIGNRLQTVRTVSPSVESIRRDHQPVFHQQQIHSVPSAFLSTTSKFQAQLDPQVHRIKKLYLRFDINIDDPTGKQLPPIWRWIERISVRANGGSAALWDYQGDIIPIRLAAEYAGAKQGFLDHVLPMLSASSFSQSQTTATATGAHSFYLPLYGWEDQVVEGLDTLCFDIYSAGRIPTSTATLTGLSFAISTDATTVTDRSAQLRLMRDTMSSRSIVEAMKVSFSNRTLAPGTEATFDLDAFTGSSVGLVVYISDSSGAQIDLAAGAHVDVENAAGRSVLGQGSLVPLDLLRTFHSHFGHSFVAQSPCTIISFTDDLAGALNRGIRSGQIALRAQKDRLVLKPGPLFPQAQYNVEIYSLTMKRLSRYGNRLDIAND